VGNVLALVATVIAGSLYGNIGKEDEPKRGRAQSHGNAGLKIVYVNVIEDFFHGPPLLSRKGRFAWTTLVIVFWGVGFVIAAAIPQIQTLSGMGACLRWAAKIFCLTTELLLVGAVTNMQFTYSFPFGFTFLYLVQLDATSDDGAYAPGSPSRVDDWSQWSRWKRVR
jgi:hypothetical protein